MSDNVPSTSREIAHNDDDNPVHSQFQESSTFQYTGNKRKEVPEYAKEPYEHDPQKEKKRKDAKRAHDNRVKKKNAEMQLQKDYKLLKETNILLQDENNSLKAENFQLKKENKELKDSAQNSQVDVAADEKYLKVINEANSTPTDDAAGDGALIDKDGNNLREVILHEGVYDKISEEFIQRIYETTTGVEQRFHQQETKINNLQEEIQIKDRIIDQQNEDIRELKTELREAKNRDQCWQSAFQNHFP